MSSDLERRIRERAFELWEAEGQPEGRDAQHWSRAEAEFAEAQAVETMPGVTATPKQRKRARQPEAAEPSQAPVNPAAKRARSRTSKPAKS